jgi:hypothetical protein
MSTKTAVLFVSSTLLLLFTAAGSQGAITAIEFSEFDNPKRVGVDPFTLGQDNLIVGFDVLPDGTAIPGGTVINTAYESVGVRFSAFFTTDPYTGQFTDTEALDFSIRNPGSYVAISSPNILSAVDPSGEPNISGPPAGLATLIATFVGPDGGLGGVSMVGAFNDLIFGQNLLTAYSGPDATGTILGSVSAEGPGDFFGLMSTESIGSITFSGRSTEVDDLVFSPVNPIPEPASIAVWSVLGVIGLGIMRRRRRTAC